MPCFPWSHQSWIRLISGWWPLYAARSLRFWLFALLHSQFQLNHCLWFASLRVRRCLVFRFVWWNEHRWPSEVSCFRTTRALESFRQDKRRATAVRGGHSMTVGVTSVDKLFYSKTIRSGIPSGALHGLRQQTGSFLLVWIQAFGFGMIQIRSSNTESIEICCGQRLVFGQSLNSVWVAGWCGDEIKTIFNEWL